MLGFVVSDSEIEDAERLLLPRDRHFDKEARSVIRRWTSTDVVACPGSGKTTVLLAKLKLLADRMPLDNGAGICVLSHTNVAVNELEKRLPDQARLLLAYPNHIGTIQSFVDKFFAAPYVKWRFGSTMHPVDNEAYGRAVLGLACGMGFSALQSVIRNNAKRGLDPISVAGGIRLDEDGNLLKDAEKKAAGAGTQSATQYRQIRQQLLVNDGLVRYRDAYEFAAKAIDEMPESLLELIRARFPYVFIDEYQDCDQQQRGFLSRVFDDAECCVIRIGDPDQAIYSSHRDQTEDWVPRSDACQIGVTNRFHQQIADVLSPLRKGNKPIRSAATDGAAKPVLMVYDDNSIDSVRSCFAEQIKGCGLGSQGVYKAVGFIGKDATKGISIGSYWDGFDSKKASHGATYWNTLVEMGEFAASGQMYRAVELLGKLLRRMHRFSATHSGVKAGDAAVDLLSSMSTDKYRSLAFDVLMAGSKDGSSMNVAVRSLVAGLVGESAATQVYDSLPLYFMSQTAEPLAVLQDRNVYIDPAFRTRIEFSTVHGVKGETHDATLYLETEFGGVTDISRVLCRYGIGKPKDSKIYETSRKVVYVGMSRPKKLLCLAVCSKTYENGKQAFEKWQKVDLR